MTAKCGALMSERIIPDEVLIESLVRCRGNVKLMAERLGVRRKSIYERHERLQRRGLALPLKAYRTADPAVVSFVGDMSRTDRVMPPHTGQYGSQAVGGDMRQDVRSGRSGAVPISSPAPVTSAPQGTTFRSMATMPMAKTQTVRVLPDDADRIARGRRRLAAALDQDLTDTQVLEMYLAGFDQWLEGQIAAPATPEKKARKREDSK